MQEQIFTLSLRLSVSSSWAHLLSPEQDDILDPGLLPSSDGVGADIWAVSFIEETPYVSFTKALKNLLHGRLRFGSGLV